MKKMILGLVFLIISFSAVYALQTGGSSTPSVPGPPNPYCNHDEPAPPSFFCGDGFIQNWQCTIDCTTTFILCINSAYEAACAAYNTANDTYITDTKLSLQHYDTCIAAATTIAEREACRDTFLQENAANTDKLNKARSRIANTLASQRDSCQYAFDNCTPSCCTLIVPPPGH